MACENNAANPYIRIYLLPDRSGATKKKTKVMKSTLNPKFDETSVDLSCVIA